MTESIFMALVVLVHVALALLANAYMHIPIRDYFVVTIFVKLIGNDARNLARKWNKRVANYDRESH